MSWYFPFTANLHLSFQAILLILPLLTFSCVSFLHTDSEVVTEMPPPPEGSLEDVQVTIELEDASVTELFKSIQVQTGFLFAYCNQDIEQTGTITIPHQTESVRHFLDMLFVQTGLNFRQLDYNVIIFRLRDQEAVAQNKIWSEPNDSRVIPSTAEEIFD